MFMWDSITMTRTFSNHFKFKKIFGMESGWPKTSYQKKTLNPKWQGKKIALKSTSCIVDCEAVIYLVVKDYDFGRTDDYLGVLPLSVQELVSMEEGESEKELLFDKPLEYYGKYFGRI